MQDNSNSNSTIDVAIVGLGFGESVHIPALQSNQKFKIASLWHPNKSKSKEVSKKYNINSHESWDLLLDDKEINALIIATPPQPRYELALQALNAGKHLLLEKPAALNADQISNLKNIAMQNNLSVAVNFEYRAVPLFMEAKRIISKGEIGTPWLIRLDWLMSSRSNPNREWNWYSQEEKGGGVIGALGTHAFDIIHWLCGPIISVNSLLSTSIKNRPESGTQKIRKVTSEDIALGQFELLGQNNNEIYPAQISLSSISREGRGFLLEIYGSKGTLTLSSSNQKDYVHGFNLCLALAGEQPKSIKANNDFIFPKTWADGRIAPVARIQDWWANSINNPHPMIPGLLEAQKSQRICDNMKLSHKYGQKVTNE